MLLSSAVTVELVILVVCGFLAGFIDAIVGGGGLIQLPTLLVLFPTAPIVSLFGTNKVASICGTSMAAWQYAKKIPLRMKTVLPATIAALIFAYLGARTVSVINPAILKPLILALLILVAIYTFKKKSLGSSAVTKDLGSKEIWISAFVGGTIGFYDGFFGPGTGSFLILAFISLFGLDFLQASASAKIVNLATNLASIIFFEMNGEIYYHLGIPMGIAQIFGAILGSKLAILKGSSFVRKLFLCVVIALIAKLGWGVLFTS